VRYVGAFSAARKPAAGATSPEPKHIIARFAESKPGPKKTEKTGCRAENARDIPANA
jgi:hypothetical protein